MSSCVSGFRSPFSHLREEVLGSAERDCLALCIVQAHQLKRFLGELTFSDPALGPGVVAVELRYQHRSEKCKEPGILIPKHIEEVMRAGVLEAPLACQGFLPACALTARDVDGLAVYLELAFVDIGDLDEVSLRSARAGEDLHRVIVVERRGEVDTSLSDS